MSQNTFVKEDEKGLFVLAGGWIARPRSNTKFHSGDKILAHHFGGTPMVGVGDRNTKFNASFRIKLPFEMWETDTEATKRLQGW